MNSPPHIRRSPYFYQFRSRAFATGARRALHSLALLAMLTILYLLARFFLCY